VVYVLSEKPSYVAFSKATDEKGKVLSEKFSEALSALRKEGIIQEIEDTYRAIISGEHFRNQSFELLCNPAQDRNICSTWGLPQKILQRPFFACFIHKNSIRCF
jgi:hypothetical protein